jgi:hypothetical protein
LPPRLCEPSQSTILNFDTPFRFERFELLVLELAATLTLELDGTFLDE